MSISWGADARDKIIAMGEIERDALLNERALNFDKIEEAKCCWCFDGRDTKKLYSWLCCKESFYCLACINLRTMPKDCPCCRKPIGKEWWAKVMVYRMFSPLELCISTVFWASWLLALRYVLNTFVTVYIGDFVALFPMIYFIGISLRASVSDGTVGWMHFAVIVNASYFRFASVTFALCCFYLWNTVYDGVVIGPLEIQYPKKKKNEKT